MTEQEQEQYDRIHCEVEDETREVWNRSMGPLLEQFPFRPDSPSVRLETARRFALWQESAVATFSPAAVVPGTDGHSAMYSATFGSVGVEMAHAGPIDFSEAVAQPIPRPDAREIVELMVATFDLTPWQVCELLGSIDFSALMIEAPEVRHD